MYSPSARLLSASEQRQHVVGNPSDGSGVANGHRRPCELAHADALVLPQVVLLARGDAIVHKPIRGALQHVKVGVAVDGLRTFSSKVRAWHRGLCWSHNLPRKHREALLGPPQRRVKGAKLIPPIRARLI